MKSTQLINRLLVLIILVCCSQENWAGAVPKGSKPKNNTTIGNQTTKQPKKVHKIKTTTTTTTTPAEPDLETTTSSAAFDLDGRNAFINNKFVADGQESIANTSPVLYDHLQPEVQTLQTNMADNFQNYDHNVPKIIEVVDDDHVEAEKLSKKPSLNYGMSQFDEYEEEETSASDDIPENSEDNQESLLDNNEDNEEDTAPDFNIKNEEDLHHSESNMFEQTYQNKPYDNSDYVSQTYAVPEVSYDHKNDETDTNQGLSQVLPQYGYGTTKPSQQSNYNKNSGASTLGTKTKPGNQQQTQSYYGQIIRKEPHQASPNQYVQTNPLEHYIQATQNFYDQSKTQPHLKTHYNMDASPQPLLNYQNPIHNKQQTNLDYSKPGNSFYNKRLQNNTLYNYFNNSQGNTNTETSPFSSTSAQNKKFKTVSSSVQYVPTPLVDLVFKYSIGMAKHTKTAQNSTDIKSYIYHAPKNINNRKTE